MYIIQISPLFPPPPHSASTLVLPNTILNSCWILSLTSYIISCINQLHLFIPNIFFTMKFSTGLIASAAAFGFSVVSGAPLAARAVINDG